MGRPQGYGFHYGWLIVGIAASIVVLASLTNGEIYDWLDFRKVERKSEPVWFWFLFVGHLIVAYGGIRTSIAWKDPQHRSRYRAQQVRHGSRMQKEKRVSKANIVPILLWAIVWATIIVIFLVYV